MIRIEFIKVFKCYEVGYTRNAMTHFAKVLIDLGYAKAIKAPRRDKMMREPVKDKSLIKNISGGLNGSL